MLFGVDGGVVERSAAFDNGHAAGGSVGIWAFDSSRIVFAHDESYGNGSPRNIDDGDGFDFDRGVSNSVMEDNYSHGNGGVGFLICSCPGPNTYPFYYMRDDVVRANVSRDDGSSGQPSLYVYGGEVMTGILVLSNRVSSASGAGPLVKVIGCVRCYGLTLNAGYRHGRLYTDVQFRGNSFASGGGKPLLVVNPGSAIKIVFHRDTWRSTRGRFLVTFGGHRLLTPSAWRSVAPSESVGEQ
jgi:hypothetical protein